MTQETLESTSLASVGRSAAILTSGTFVAEALIVVRELFLAAQVGLTGSLDALLVGITLPVALAGILTAGLATALVPAYAAVKTRRGSKDALRLAGTVLLWVVVAAVVVWVLLHLFAAQIVAVIGSGLAPGDQASATGYLRVVAPVVVISSAAAILLAVCQAERYFVAMALSTIGTAVASVMVMLLLWTDLSLMAYAAGSLIGPATGLGIAFAATVRRSIVPIPRIRPRHLGLRALVRHAIPLTVSSSVLQLSVVTSRAVASLVGPGAISAVRYGELLVKVPIGAIGPAWGSAIYPTLVQTTQAPNPHSLGMTVARAMRFTIAAFTPIAFLSAATAPVIVSVAYGRGAVTEEQLELTARVVVCLAPMILVAMTNPVMTGALNARRRGTTLLASGLLNVFLNIVLAITLGLAIGAPGIALASSSSGGASVAFKVWRLSMDEDRFSARALGRYLSLACVSALPATVVVGLIAWSVGPIDQLVLGLALLGTSGITGIIAYAVFARLSGMVEVQELQRLVSGRLTILVRRSVPR